MKQEAVDLIEKEIGEDKEEEQEGDLDMDF